MRDKAVGSEDLTKACQAMGEWLSKDLTVETVVKIVRPFFNAWISRSQLVGLDFILPPIFNFLEKEKFLDDAECRRLFCAILGKLTALKEQILSPMEKNLNEIKEKDKK